MKQKISQKDSEILKLKSEIESMKKKTEEIKIEVNSPKENHMKKQKDRILGSSSSPVSPEKLEEGFIIEE